MSVHITDQEIIRASYLAACAAVVLNDLSYVNEITGRAHELTRGRYNEMLHDVQARLLENGYAKPDEDIFEARGL